MADKKYYWLKLNKDFFDQHEVKIIEAAGKDQLLFYIKLLCESVSHNGELRFSDKVPYTRDMLSSVTYTNPYVVDSAMDLLLDLGLIEYENDGTYVMTKVPSMIGHETKWAEKKRTYRETLKGHSEDNVLDESSEKRTMSDKSIEYRDKSIDIKEKNIKEKSRFVKPSVNEIRTYCQERNNKVDPQTFFDFYESKGWMVGKNHMKDWKAAVRTWEKGRKTETAQKKNGFQNFDERQYDDEFYEQLMKG